MKIISSEQRIKISETLKRKGIKPPSRKGIKFTEEQRIKLLGRVPWNKGKKLPPFSEETKKRMGEAHKGAKCHFWKGGVTPINQAIRMSYEYGNWRRAVFERDNYTCQDCGNNESGNLNADHIKPFALYPELRFVVENGRTLCKSCHKKTKTYGRKLKSYQLIK